MRGADRRTQGITPAERISELAQSLDLTTLALLALESSTGAYFGLPQ